MEKIRLGVIGGGSWGNYHLLAAKQMDAEGMADLVAIADKDEEIAYKQSEAFGINKYSDYKEMIAQEDLDAVSISTPDHLHREIAMFALEQGLHVLVEKPLDLTTTGCKLMVDLADKMGCMLMVDFHKRYESFNMGIFEKIRQGSIGQPLYSYAYMEDKIIIPTEMLKKWAGESSPFWFIGVHKLDLIRWLTGLDPVSVYAKGFKNKLVNLGIDTYDAVSARILMQNEFSCTIDVNWIIPGNFEAMVNQGLRIIGTDGVVEIDGQDRGLRFLSGMEGTTTPNFGAINIKDSLSGYKNVSGYYVDPIKDFISKVSYIKNGGELNQLSKSYPDGWDGLMATRVAAAVELSIKEARPVDIDEIPLQ